MAQIDYPRFWNLRLRMAKRLRAWATRLDKGAGRTYFGFATRDIRAGQLVGEGDFAYESTPLSTRDLYMGDRRLKGRR